MGSNPDPSIKFLGQKIATLTYLSHLSSTKATYLVFHRSFLPLILKSQSKSEVFSVFTIMLQLVLLVQLLILLSVMEKRRLKSYR